MFVKIKRWLKGPPQMAVAPCLSLFKTKFKKKTKQNRCGRGGRKEKKNVNV
jgi:hypothetical protein